MVDMVIRNDASSLYSFGIGMGRMTDHRRPKQSKTQIL